MFVISQQVNLWGAAAWAFFIFGGIKLKSWAIPVGTFAAVMSMIGGYPMGIHSVIEAQGFLMFLPVPILSKLLLIVLLLPTTQKLLTDQKKDQVAAMGFN